MFCTTLRKRPQWESVPSTLLSQEQPRWQEQKLETFDIALPLPQTNASAPRQLFRALLISSDEIKNTAQVMDRVERLAHQNGGRYVGIFFLLGKGTSPEHGTRGYMNFQIEIMATAFEIPVIPLHSVSSLQSTLLNFQKQIIQTQRTTSPPKIDPLRTLLPFCSVNGLIPEHARNILGDICHSMPELAQAASTKDGQEGLGKWFADNPDLMGVMVGFWEQEFVLD